jgi:two-component system chemotaxis response regulator CheB
MTRRDGVLALGGSAGSIEALVELVARLPADLRAPVLVTVHTGGNARSTLPQILARSGPLPAVHARHGEPLRTGTIHVAPPDLHLLAGSGVARLSRGPRVNRHRPAVDVMFAGAVRWAGGRLVAAVLSGALDDGAVGSALVARAGGRVVVQDPADALFDSMPRAALSAVPAATTAPAVELADVVVAALDAVADEHAGEVDAGEVDAGEIDEERGGSGVAEVNTGGMRMGDSDDPGFLDADEVRLTRLSCPDCGGGLAELTLPGIRYYRCHVAHQYSPRSLEAAQREAAESKLWAAATALEEHAALARHLAARSDRALTDGYRRSAERSARTARSLLSSLEAHGIVTSPVEAPGPG